MLFENILQLRGVDLRFTEHEKEAAGREGGGKREMNETSATASDPHACARE